jgi:hypothetical protein
MLAVSVHVKQVMLKYFCRYITLYWVIFHKIRFQWIVWELRRERNEKENVLHSKLRMQLRRTGTRKADLSFNLNLILSASVPSSCIYTLFRHIRDANGIILRLCKKHEHWWKVIYKRESECARVCVCVRACVCVCVCVCVCDSERIYVKK